MTPEQVNQLIRQRRAVYPRSYSDLPIPREVVEEILENANWAPTHRLTQPWRFKVFMGDSRQALSQYLGDYYKENTPDNKFSDIKYSKTVGKPLKAACVIAICMQADPSGSVPEEEEIAAVAMAVQNMWLSCSAHGIGAYWSSPAAAYNADIFLGLAPGERCLGFFYMGYHEGELPPGRRGPISEKVSWM
jgi:nitroreductase